MYHLRTVKKARDLNLECLICAFPQSNKHVHRSYTTNSNTVRTQQQLEYAYYTMTFSSPGVWMAIDKSDNQMAENPSLPPLLLSLSSLPDQPVGTLK